MRLADSVRALTAAQLMVAWLICGPAAEAAPSGGRQWAAETSPVVVRSLTHAVSVFQVDATDDALPGSKPSSMFSANTPVADEQLSPAYIRGTSPHLLTAFTGSRTYQKPQFRPLPNYQRAPSRGQVLGSGRIRPPPPPPDDLAAPLASDKFNHQGFQVPINLGKGLVTSDRFTDEVLVERPVAAGFQQTSHQLPAVLAVSPDAPSAPTLGRKDRPVVYSRSPVRANGPRQPPCAAARAAPCAHGAVAVAAIPALVQPSLTALVVVDQQDRLCSSDNCKRVPIDAPIVEHALQPSVTSPLGEMSAKVATTAHPLFNSVHSNDKHFLAAHAEDNGRALSISVLNAFSKDNPTLATLNAPHKAASPQATRIGIPIFATPASVFAGGHVIATLNPVNLQPTKTLVTINPTASYTQVLRGEAVGPIQPSHTFQLDTTAVVQDDGGNTLAFSKDLQPPARPSASRVEPRLLASTTHSAPQSTAKPEIFWLCLNHTSRTFMPSYNDFMRVYQNPLLFYRPFLSTYFRPVVVSTTTADIAARGRITQRKLTIPFTVTTLLGRGQVFKRRPFVYNNFPAQSPDVFFETPFVKNEGFSSRKERPGSNRKKHKSFHNGSAGGSVTTQRPQPPQTSSIVPPTLAMTPGGHRGSHVPDNDDDSPPGRTLPPVDDDEFPTQTPLPDENATSTETQDDNSDTDTFTERDGSTNQPRSTTENTSYLDDRDQDEDDRSTTTVATTQETTTQFERGDDDDLDEPATASPPQPADDELEDHEPPALPQTTTEPPSTTTTTETPNDDGHDSSPSDDEHTATPNGGREVEDRSRMPFDFSGPDRHSNDSEIFLTQEPKATIIPLSGAHDDSAEGSSDTHDDDDCPCRRNNRRPLSGSELASKRKEATSHSSHVSSSSDQVSATVRRSDKSVRISNDYDPLFVDFTDPNSIDQPVAAKLLSSKPAKQKPSRSHPTRANRQRSRRLDRGKARRTL